MQTPYCPRGPLRISLLPPLCTQNTEAGLASAKARSGARASSVSAARTMNGRMLFSRFVCNRAARCEDVNSVYTAATTVGILGGILGDETFMRKLPVISMFLAGLVLLPAPGRGRADEY